MNSKVPTKYIFVTGGVCSSLGKGVAASSLGCLLKARGYEVAMMKLDPYLNVDPGTQNPYEHGECYVTDDGFECDLDIGHYERFVDAKITKDSSITTGQVYKAVLEKERTGEFLGQTIQIIPHVTNEIKDRIKLHAKKTNAQIQIVEIGGTVGDIESIPFVEAIRQFAFDVGIENTLYIHLTLVPHLKAAGELKTKPTQHSVRTLLESGIQPDILLCRAYKPLTPELKNKIALFCNLSPEDIFSASDVHCSIYEIPTNFSEQKLDDRCLDILHLNKNHELRKDQFLIEWNKMLNNIFHPTNTVNIAICGKYTTHQDAYKSIDEALIHAGAKLGVKINTIRVNTENIHEEKDLSVLKKVQGIIVPGGFGERGFEGKVMVAKYARENNIPYLGICFGMHAAVVDFARYCGLDNANTTEINPDTPYPVIHLLKSQKDVTEKGATMRLGEYNANVLESINDYNTLTYRLYQKHHINERHRHRFEFNRKYYGVFKENDMITTAYHLQGSNMLPEIVEYTKNRFHIGCQFHPEMKSRPMNPHPLFFGLVEAANELAIKKSDDIQEIIDEIFQTYDHDSLCDLAGKLAKHKGKAQGYITAALRQNPNEDVLSTLFNAMSWMHKDDFKPAWVELLRYMQFYLNHPDTDIRESAVYALTPFEEKEVRNLLYFPIQHNDPDVMEAIADFLTEYDIEFVKEILREDKTD